MIYNIQTSEQANETEKVYTGKKNKKTREKRIQGASE